MPAPRLLAALLMLMAPNAVIGETAAGSVLNVGGSRLDVRLDARFSSGADAPWDDWLTTSAQAVASISGELPYSRVAVRLTDAPRNNAITFGRVRRGSPPLVQFHVNPRAGLEDLLADWRGFHEFAHLLLPFPGNRDIWFSEGLASYYQYLLQSRAGVITADSAWRELLGGFERGERDSAGRGESLRSLSPQMRRKRAFRRVYWTGAAYFLRVDVRLRTESGGRHSLDSALAGFHHCCMDERRRWNARALIGRLGELSVPEIWQEEYRRMIDAPAEPDYENVLETLGIRVSRRGIRFSDDPVQETLRRAVAAP